MRHDELLIVLKALEIRAQRQASQIKSSAERAETAIDQAKSERAEWDSLLDEFELQRPERVAPQRFRKREITVPEEMEWEEIVGESKSILDQEGIDSEELKLALPNQLDRHDVVAALTIGAISAVLPSIGGRHGSMTGAFQRVQVAADKFQLPELVQKLFGNKPAQFMDAGAAGAFHRFVDGHDLLWAAPNAVKELGLARGIVEVFQHLIRDSFGPTGVPLPGSSLLGDAVAEQLGGSRLSDVIPAKDLSRYAAIRMTDGVATCTTSLLLWGYLAFRGINSDSSRACKLAILAHGLCSVGVGVIACAPGLQVAAAGRSHVNYISIAAVARNAIKLASITRLRREENAERYRSLAAAVAHLSNTQKARIELHNNLSAMSTIE